MVVTLSDGGSITIKDWLQSNRSKIEYFEFSNGTRWDKHAIGDRTKVTGTDDNNSWNYSNAQINLGHQGGGGDDIIMGGKKNDKYYYNLGDGNDTIDDSKGADTLIFGNNITPADLTIKVIESDMVVSFADGGSITISSWLQNNRSKIEYFEFADGTRWDKHAIGDRTQVTGTDDNNSWNYSNTQTNLGHQGGLGDDVMTGGKKRDKYYYNLGDGNDTINDSWGTNTLILGEEISTHNVNLQLDGSDLVVHILDGGSIRIKDQFSNSRNSKINAIEFGNGEKWNNQTLKRNMVTTSEVPPTLTSTILVPSLSTEQTVDWNISQHFSNNSAGILQFSATGLPNGLTISNDGIISGELVDSIGSYNVAITVDDGKYAISKEITLSLANTNQAPVYESETAFTFIAGKAFTADVWFSDANDNLATQNIIASNLPSWLSYNSNTSQLQGYAPINAQGVYSISLTATNSQGLFTTAHLSLTVEAETVKQVRHITLSQQLAYAEYNTVFDLSVAQEFNVLEQADGDLSYQLEILLVDGTWQALPTDHWLSIDNMGQLTGTPSQSDVSEQGNKIRITASNINDDSFIGEFTLKVNGPLAKTIGTIEATNDKAIRIDVSEYFSGLSASAVYGISVVETQVEPVAVATANSARQNITSSLPTPLLSIAESFSSENIDMDHALLADEPVVLNFIEGLPQWLTFDSETGLLSGIPPTNYTELFTLAFTAEDGEIQLETLAEFTIGDSAESKTYWFTYDDANRVEIDGGSLLDNEITIAEQGSYIAYNNVGKADFIINNGGYTAQRLQYNDQGYLTNVQQTYQQTLFGEPIESGVNLYDDKTARTWDNVGWANQVYHRYNLNNQRDKTVNYYEAGTIQAVTYSGGGTGGLSGFANLSNSVRDIQEFSYNDDGKMQQIHEYSISNEKRNLMLNELLDENPGTGSRSNPLFANLSEYQVNDIQNIVTYKYDRKGLLERVDYNDPGSQYEDSSYQRFSYRYEGREGYLEKSVLGTGSEGYQPATTNSFYDANGNRTVIQESNTINSGMSARYFTQSADSKMLNKTTGIQNSSFQNVDLESERDPRNTGNYDRYGNYIGPTTIAEAINFREDTGESAENSGPLASHYLHANNQYLGELRENGEINVKQQHFEGINISNPQSSQRHQVRTGDTLQSIATIYYGNPEYWYIIADANGLPNAADAELSAGQTIEIPQQVNNENSFDTFSAYSILEQIGDTKPALPYVMPPPPEAGCNVVASLIMVAVAVVVTAATSGATANLLGPALAGAVGASAGSIASQVVGIGLGVQDGINWTNVAVAAVSGAIAGGISEAAGVGGDPSTASNSILLEAGEKAAQLSAPGRALVGAASYLGGVATNRVIGNPTGFSWANLAASAVGSAVGSALPGDVGSGNILTDFGNNIIGAAASHATRKLVNNEGSWSNEAVVVDAFGNAIGNSIVAGMQSKQTQANTNKAKDTIAKAVENGATPQEAVQQVAQQIASENGGTISGGRASYTDEYTGTGTTLTNSKGETAEFFIDNATTVQSGYNLIESMSDFLGSSPGAGMMLGMATNQIIGQTQRHHDARMNSIQYLDMAKYKLGGANGVFDRPAMVGIPGVTPGPWAPEFLQGAKGASAGLLNTISQPSGFGPWREGYIFPKESKLLSNVSSVADWTSAIAQSSHIANEFAARSKIINMLNSSKGIPVNSLRIDYLKNVSTPLSMTANTYAPITSAKSFEVLAKLNGTPVYSGLNAVSKYAPGVYAASQLGSEVYYAVENDVSLDIASRNVGSRALGTAVELGGGLASFKAGAAAGAPIGAGIGAFFGGVGAAPGALIGSAVGGIAGTLTYTFSGLGTTINNTVTETTRDIIGWFNE
jgi:hypothetical protein